MGVPFPWGGGASANDRGIVSKKRVLLVIAVVVTVGTVGFAGTTEVSQGPAADRPVSQFKFSYVADDSTAYEDVTTAGHEVLAITYVAGETIDPEHVEVVASRGGRWTDMDADGDRLRRASFSWAAGETTPAESAVCGDAAESGRSAASTRDTGLSPTAGERVCIRSRSPSGQLPPEISIVWRTSDSSDSYVLGEWERPGQ
jgi:hypothetical protein